MIDVEQFTDDNIELIDSYGDLALMTKEQLLGQIMRYRKYIDRLEQWQLDAFEVEPNIDLDIERIRAIRMRENMEKTYDPNRNL